MGRTTNYMILICILAWCNTHAQQQINDSVFSQSTLTSIPLTNIADNKTFACPSTCTGHLSLFIFLSPECPLCQNYTTTLNKLAKQYNGKVTCYGIFPGKAYTIKEIRTFREKYKITYPLLVDGSFRLSRYLHANVTPETILLNDRNELVYKGAIDNWLKDLGKMQTRTTANYLQDAIDHYPDQHTPKRTKAVGCLINDR